MGKHRKPMTKDEILKTLKKCRELNRCMHNWDDTEALTYVIEQIEELEIARDANTKLKKEIVRLRVEKS